MPGNGFTVLSPGIYQVDVRFYGSLFGGNHRPERKNTVFTMKCNLNSFRNKAGYQRGDTDAQVDYGAIKKLFSGSHGDSFPA